MRWTNRHNKPFDIKMLVTPVENFSREGKRWIKVACNTWKFSSQVVFWNFEWTERSDWSERSFFLQSDQTAFCFCFFFVVFSSQISGLFRQTFLGTPLSRSQFDSLEKFLTAVTAKLESFFWPKKCIFFNNMIFPAEKVRFLGMWHGNLLLFTCENTYCVFLIASCAAKNDDAVLPLFYEFFCFYWLARNFEEKVFLGGRSIFLNLVFTHGSSRLQKIIAPSLTQVSVWDCQRRHSKTRLSVGQRNCHYFSNNIIFSISRFFFQLWHSQAQMHIKTVSISPIFHMWFVNVTWNELMSFSKFLPRRKVSSVLFSCEN